MDHVYITHVRESMSLMIKKVEKEGIKKIYKRTIAMQFYNIHKLEAMLTPWLHAFFVHNFIVK